MQNMMTPLLGNGNVAPLPNNPVNVAPQHAQGPGRFPISPGGNGPFGGMAQGIMSGMQDYRQSMGDWRGQRPDMKGMDPTAFQQAMTTWQQARPDRPDIRSLLFGQQNALAPTSPVMTPGGGVTGAPLQGTVPAAPVVVPGAGVTPPPGYAAPMVGTSLGVIGATPATTAYGLPTY